MLENKSNVDSGGGAVAMPRLSMPRRGSESPKLGVERHRTADPSAQVPDIAEAAAAAGYWLTPPT